VFGFRPRDIRNGLAMPPHMSLRNVLQMVARPSWSWHTLRCGAPRFASLAPYMPQGLDLGGIGKFMNDTFSGRLTRERIAALRECWKGKLVIKGVASEEDARVAVELGVDGLIVSNHGGRQLDAGESSVAPMTRIARELGERIEVMLDSGIRSGPDVARALASGARFTFLGRAFMYGVAALGERGGRHTVELLSAQLRQVMEQVGCERVGDFPRFLAGEEPPEARRYSAMQ
jgi:L-lactate dehydrogenase (cytochrome)